MTQSEYFTRSESIEWFLRLFDGRFEEILAMRAAGRRDKLTGEYRPPDGAMGIAYRAGWNSERKP